MQMRIITPSPSDAAAMDDAIAETMAGILFDRSVFDLEAAETVLDACGFPAPVIRALATIAVERAKVRATRY